MRAPGFGRYRARTKPPPTGKVDAVRFTDSLRGAAAPIWEAELRHPFVRGIADGSLAVEKFQFYLCQDYLFLIEYCRVFALACANRCIAINIIGYCCINSAAKY